jgi:amidase
MARYVEDLILAMSIISGPNGRDPHVMPVPFKDPYQVNLKSLKIAYYADDSSTTPTKEIQNTIREAALALKKHVSSVDESRPQTSGEAYRLLWETIFLGGDKGVSFKNWLQYIGVKNPSPLLQEYIHMAENCEFSVSDLRMRMREIDQYKIDMLKFMSPYDAIICPVAATPAKPHGRALKEITDFTYTMSHNLTGWPGVVVRCGTSSEGLPIGVQVLSKPWQDDVALAVAKVLENCFGGWKPPIL